MPLFDNDNSLFEANLLSLSIVVPTFNASGHIDKLIKTLVDVGPHFLAPLEVVLVDDCSSDDTVKKLQSLCRSLPCDYQIISLHKNIGQTKATAIGLTLATNDVIVTLDDDLQHPIKQIPLLTQRLVEDDLDFVVGEFEIQDQSRLRRASSWLARLIARRSLETPQGHFFSSFIAFSRHFVQQIGLGERSQVEVGWMYKFSDRFANVRVEHLPSLRGYSTYRVGSLLKAARPFTLHILGKLVRPLIFLGVVIFFFAFLLGAYYLALYLSSGKLPAGFSTLALIGSINLGLLSLFSAVIIRLLLEVRTSLQRGAILDTPRTITSSRRNSRS